MDFDWQFEVPGYDAGNLAQYESMGGDQGGFAMDWDSFDDESMTYDMPAMDMPSMSDALRSGDSPYYSSTPGMTEMANPAQSVASVGQPGPTSGPKAEDDWLSQLKKGGMGMAVGAGTNLLGAGIQKMMAPAQQKQSSVMSQTQPGQQYTPQPLENTPGTKASPLISGRPTSVIGSQGLKGKRAPTYGGFSMY